MFSICTRAPRHASRSCDCPQEMAFSNSDEVSLMLAAAQRLLFLKRVRTAFCLLFALYQWDATTINTVLGEHQGSQSPHPTQL